MAKAQKNFLTGAMLFTVFSALSKVIGAIYKIPLNNMIGTAGASYYNDGYQIYALLYILSTAGIPVAIAKMVSEANAKGRLNEPRKILKNSLVVFGIVGLVLAVLMALFVEPISKLLQNGDTVNYCIALIAPAIFFASVSAVIKGFFQGYKCMTPSSVFQVIESFFKLSGLVFLWLLIQKGYGDNFMVLACGGILGVTFSSFISSLFMIICLLREKNFGAYVPDAPASHSRGKIINTIITLAIPISLSNAVMSVTSTLDMIFVKFSLGQFGQTVEQAIDTYGAYIGSTSSLFNLPPTLTIGVGAAVLPFLTGAFATGEQGEAYSNMRSATKVVSLIAMPCALGMSVMSEGIIKLLYNEAYWAVGVPTMRLLALSIFFVSFVSLTGSFLHSVGKVKITLLTMGVGALIKLTVNLLMVANIGIMGAPVGTFTCYGTIFLLNLVFIRKYMGFTMPFKDAIVKPFICTALCCAAAYGSWWGLCTALGYSKLWVLVALCVAGAVYVAGVLLLKVLTPEDLALVPGGKKLEKILAKRGLIGE